MTTVELVDSWQDGQRHHEAEFKNWRHAMSGAGVLAHTISLTVTETNRVLTVPAFDAWVPNGSGGLVYVSYAGGTVNVTASASTPRMDLLTVDSAGTVGMQDGIATAETGTVREAPLPDLDDDEILLAVVRSPANQANVLADNIRGRAVNVKPAKARKGTDIVCAATISLPDDGQYFHVTGSTGPITAIEARPAGTVVVLEFDSTPTITHHATSLIMPGSASPTVAAGDVYSFISEGSGNWRCIGNTVQPATVLAGQATAATATTSTSAVDLVTISGLNIPVGAWATIMFNYRKTATNATAVHFGLKLNGTVVAEASGTTYVATMTTNNRAEDGLCIITIGPRSSADYLQGFMAQYATRASSSGATAGTPAIVNLATSAAMPNAALTSLAIRAINDTSNNNAEVFNVRVLVTA